MHAPSSKSPDYFSFPQRWDAQDLADAMPLRLRLSQMVDFDAIGAAASANAPARRPRALQRGYVRNAELPLLFRIR